MPILPGFFGSTCPHNILALPRAIPGELGSAAQRLYLTFGDALVDDRAICSLWQVQDEHQLKVALFRFKAMKLWVRLRGWQPSTRTAQLLCGLALLKSPEKRGFPCNESA